MKTCNKCKGGYFVCLECNELTCYCIPPEQGAKWCAGPKEDE